MGVATLWLSLIVLLPLTAVVVRSLDGGVGAFWDAVTSRQAIAALRFTVLVCARSRRRSTSSPAR